MKIWGFNRKKCYTDPNAAIERIQKRLTICLILAMSVMVLATIFFLTGVARISISDNNNSGEATKTGKIQPYNRIP